jgi:CarboxypepD_reg-like domain
MSKNLQLHIPVPCNENWNEMTPEKQGKFCLSCQKTVVDFTRMTDYEIIQFFKNTNGNTCGRFYDDQLNKKYEIESKKRLKWFKYFISIMFPALIFANKSYSQGMVKKKPATCTSPTKRVSTERVILGDIGATIFLEPVNSVNGKVINENGEAVAGASIMIKGTKEGIAADMDGEFLFSTKQNLPLKLLVTSVGYEEREVTINGKDDKLPVIIEMKQKVMEEVVITLYNAISCRRVTMGGAISSTSINIFQDISRKIADSFGISSTKVYPNPLRKSAILTVELETKQNGSYTALFADMNGKYLQVEQFNVVGKGIQKQIRIKPEITPGTYVLTVIDPKGKRLTSQKLIMLD